VASYTKYDCLGAEFVSNWGPNCISRGPDLYYIRGVNCIRLGAKIVSDNGPKLSFLRMLRARSRLPSI
jgi:hypothetical protein